MRKSRQSVWVYNNVKTNVAPLVEKGVCCTSAGIKSIAMDSCIIIVCAFHMHKVGTLVVCLALHQHPHPPEAQPRAIFYT